jgi:hypothetical protein
MKAALARTHSWIRLFRYQPLTIRLLAISAALITAAAAFSAPAEASPVDDNFLGALGKSGVGAPPNAVSLGQSICPMLAKPGGSFAGAVAKIKGGGVSPGMADMFAQIAIQMYCPSMMADVANGNMPKMPNIPGMPGMIPGI